MKQFKPNFFILGLSTISVFMAIFFQNCGITSNFESESMLSDSAPISRNNVATSDTSSNVADSFCENTNSFIDSCKSYVASTGIACIVVDKNGNLLYHSLGNGPMKTFQLDCVASNNSADSTQPTSPPAQSPVNSIDTSKSNCTNTSAASAWPTFNRPGLHTDGLLSGGSSQAVVSYKFSVDQNIYHKGVVIDIEPSALGAQDGREVFISECPYDFARAPEGNNIEMCKNVYSAYSRMNLVLSDYESFYRGSCVIKPGKTYYLNMRSSKDSFGSYIESAYMLSTERLN